MAIQTRNLGSLKATGYQFENKAAATYRLPPNPTGYSVHVTRWSGSGTWSLDVVGTTSREVVISQKSTSSSTSWVLPIGARAGAEGVDLIFKNSTHIYCTVAPGNRRIPPKI